MVFQQVALIFVLWSALSDGYTYPFKAKINQQAKMMFSGIVEVRKLQESVFSALFSATSNWRLTLNCATLVWINQEMGTVEVLKINPKMVQWDGSIGEGVELTVNSKVALGDAYIGCSIAVNGVCLTAISYDDKQVASRPLFDATGFFWTKFVSASTSVWTTIILTPSTIFFLSFSLTHLHISTLSLCFFLSHTLPVYGWFSTWDSSPI